MGTASSADPAFPEASSFFASVGGGWPAERVAGLYARAGWSVRASGPGEREARCAFAELVIESADPVLVHGPVADVEANAERVVRPLRDAGLPFAAECYGEAGELLRELRSPE